MTEAEWLVCDDPAALLGFIGRRVSNRKLRLFAVACARRLARLLTDPRSCNALDVAERYADRGRKGPPSQKELEKAELDAWAVAHALNSGPDYALWNAAQAATETASRSAFRAAQSTAKHAEFAVSGRRAEEQRAQAGLFRCVFGNPFRLDSLPPVGRSARLTPLAQAAYDQRVLPSGELDLARLAVLSDALEEAGCDDAELLGHLRSPGPHVRGCWVVDLLLGKE
jgi:hypothetical protein